MPNLTDEARKAVADLAERYGFSGDAVAALLAAIAAGHGSQAQFNRPELGGMGQWSRGGMVMIGDMFNDGLKSRVAALCDALAELLGSTKIFAGAPNEGQHQTHGADGAANSAGGQAQGRWPADLGQPASTGSQNDLHYAVFPAAHRLAIARGDKVTVYDTGDHRIGGFSQQQGGGQSISFTSQHGLIQLADLPVVSGDSAAPAAAPASRPDPSPSPHAGSHDEIFAKLERLAELRKKDIISAQDFDAKKAELLARL